MMWTHCRDFLKQKHGLFIILTPFFAKLNTHKPFLAYAIFSREDLVRNTFWQQHKKLCFYRRHIKAFSLSHGVYFHRVPCWISAIFGRQQKALTGREWAAVKFPIKNELSVRLFCGHIKYSRKSNTAIWLKKLKSQKMKKALTRCERILCVWVEKVEGYSEKWKHTPEWRCGWALFLWFSLSELKGWGNFRRYFWNGIFIKENFKQNS